MRWAPHWWNPANDDRLRRTLPRSPDRFSCTSVPIHCPQGDILGVLDLTREGPLGRVHDSTALLAMAVSQIESRMFNKSYPDQIVLAFHSRRQYLESPWQGLLAVSLGGQISRSAPRPDGCCGPNVRRWSGNVVKSFSGSMPCNCYRVCTRAVSAVANRHSESLQDLGGAPAFDQRRQAPAHHRENRQTTTRSQALAGSNVRYARALRMARQGLANELPVLSEQS